MRAWQRECARLSNSARFVVMALHRRAGKTEIALKKLLEDVEHALRRSVPVLKNGENTLLWMPGVRPAEICRGGGGNRVLIAFVNRFEGDFRSAAANQYFNSGGTKA